MPQPFTADLKHAAKDNAFFRSVIFTGDNSQLVLMALEPGQDIGSEVHHVDQILYIVDGAGESVLDGTRLPFHKGAVICVPAGVTHNIVNTGDEALKLFTVYAPPQHAAGTVHASKADAVAAEEKLLPAAV